MGSGCSMSGEEPAPQELRRLSASPLLGTSHKVGCSDETFGASLLSADALRIRQQASPEAAAAETCEPVQSGDGIEDAPPRSPAGLGAAEVFADGKKKSPLRRPRRKSLPAGFGAGPGSTFHSVATRAISPGRKDSNAGISDAVRTYEDNRWSPLRRYSQDQRTPQQQQHQQYSRGMTPSSVSPSEAGGSTPHRRATHVVVPTTGKEGPQPHLSGYGGVPVLTADGWYSTTGSITSCSAVVRSGAFAIGSRTSRVAGGGGRGGGMSFGSLDAGAAAPNELHEARKLSTDDSRSGDAVLTFSACAPVAVGDYRMCSINSGGGDGSRGTAAVPTGSSISFGIGSGELPPLPPMSNTARQGGST
jgi:hypothetical protein